MEYRLSARKGKARTLVVRFNSSLHLYRGLPRPTTTAPSKQVANLPNLSTRVWRTFMQVYRICSVSSSS